MNHNILKIHYLPNKIRVVYIETIEALKIIATYYLVLV